MGPERPDPCSLWQPDGVHASSAVIYPERFAWSDNAWKGVSLQDLIVYELHVGTFTREGTFDALIPRLEALRDLGVTAIELMPVSQFPNDRNWGYDGVDLYAVQNSYGGPHGLQRFVDRCHGLGLAVLLDVVYNHFGPEGNYLREFGPYFTDRYKTPWGEAVNYDGPGSDPVRDFILDNARMWLDEYHLDGLRLDAVHAIYDLGARHLLRSIKEAANDVAARKGRAIHIIAESDLNDPRLMIAPERGGHGLDAQWADDFHHAVHTVLTGELRGYYQDFGKVEHLATVLEQPYLYAWDYSPHRDRKHGAPAPPELAGDRFVVCVQNHDQVGNRARGERLASLVQSPAQLRLAASLLLLSPYVPMLFMGEEYAEEHPFPFFCSFSDEHLQQAVREGRKREFADFDWHQDIPDPCAEATRDAARLSWSWPEETPRAGLRRLYRDLLSARRVWPALRDFTRRPTSRIGDDGTLIELVRGNESTLHVYFNLSHRPQSLPASAFDGSRSLLFSSESATYAGARSTSTFEGNAYPFECIAIGPAAWQALG